MAQFIYRYIFNDGSCYVGADAMGQYKRAADHFAEALKVYAQKVYGYDKYASYITYWGHESNQHELFVKDPQRISEYWGTMSAYSFHNIKEKSLQQEVNNRKLKNKVLEKINPHQNLLIGLLTPEPDLPVLRRKKFEEELKNDMEDLMSNLYEWDYLEISGYTNDCKNNFVETTETNLDTKKVKQTQLSYYKFLLALFGVTKTSGSGWLHTVEALETILTQQQGYELLGQQFFPTPQLVLNDKAGDKRITDELKDSISFQINKQGDTLKIIAGQITIDNLEKDKDITSTNNQKVNMTLYKHPLEYTVDKQATLNQCLQLLNQYKWTQDTKKMFEETFKAIKTNMNKEI